MTESAPDSFGTLAGWKGLLANSAGSLFSPNRTAWPEREKLAAECAHKGHVPPVKHCGCGIYACKTFADLKAHGYNIGNYEGMLWVVAKLDMWGGYGEGAIGFRTQFAYPKKVFVPASHLRLGALIRERYGCQIGIIDRYTGKGGAS
jgi:hypothetical protein